MRNNAMTRVLICDDQELIRECFSALLACEAGITVVGEATNGREALQLTGTLRPDVVLMDLRMPVMDGAEAAQAIAETYPGTHVIMLTSHDEPDDVLRCLQARADAYVLKVISGAELVSVIARVRAGERFTEIIGTPHPHLPSSYSSLQP